MSKQDIRNLYIKVKQQVAEYANKYKSKEEVNLVAVSKYANQEQIEILLEEGHADFGESRVLETVSKWKSLKKKYPGINLHLIGKLQSNKVKDAVKIFDVIQSIDSAKLLTCVHEEANKQGVKIPKCFIQVNIGQEPQKNGASITDLSGILNEANKLNIKIEGLMCIHPHGLPAFPYFAMMKNLTDHYNLKKLSQGMSQDFETAIKFGATIVRIGSKIFGNKISE